MAERKNGLARIIENVSLKPYNSFGVEANARYFVELNTIQEAINFLSKKYCKNVPYLILGTGSNILFTDDFPGYVLKVGIKGITKLSEDKDSVYIRAFAGEAWDDLVRYCVENHWGGVENLSLIPGSVGAAPIQNIGSYGAEVKDVVYEVEAAHFNSGEIRIFPRVACNFGYRDSIFKTALRGQFLILSVIFKLSKRLSFNISYGALSNELQLMGIQDPSIYAIREAVCRIRRSMLPDPSYRGNAGSFFKNPVIGSDKYFSLKMEYQDLISFELPEGHYKLAAGWMIEKCGWKGKRHHQAGVYENHALVIVNHGGAEGKEILELAVQIKESVFNKFGVNLEYEVQII